MKHFVWLSFDLAVKGDYEGMYTWLDNHGAKECGDSVACFWYEHTGDLKQSIKRDLKEHVELDAKRNRIYLIHLVEGKMKGSFVFGRRRNAPWTGHAETGEDADDSSV
jgi:hypothetical protein